MAEHFGVIRRNPRRRGKAKHQAGFTLIELVVIAPVMLFAIGYTMGFLIDLYASSLAKTAKLNLRLDAQTLSSTMQNDLYYATRLTSGSIAGDPSPPSGGWSIVPNGEGRFKALEKGVPLSGARALFVAVELQTTSKASAAGRQIIFDNTSGLDCNDIAAQQTPRLNYIIYYVAYRDNTNNLYRRVVPASNSGNACPVGAQSSRAATCTKISVDCPAGMPSDILMASNLSSIDMSFFTVNNTLVNGQLSSASSPILRADLTVVLKQLIQGEDNTATAATSIKVTNCMSGAASCL